MNDITCTYKYIKSIRKQLSSYHTLACAMAHLKCINQIDERCLVLTVLLHKSTQIEEVARVISLRINRSVCGDIKPNISDQPGIIISYDVEGTRNNKPVLRDPIYPHFHALIILPGKIPVPQDRQKLKENIGEGIKSLDEVSNVWLNDFDPTRQSILRTIDYITKFDGAAARHKIGKNTFIPTLDFFSDKLCRQSREGLFERISELFDSLIWDHRPFFSHPNQKILLPGQAIVLNHHEKIGTDFGRDEFKRKHILKIRGEYEAKYLPSTPGPAGSEVAGANQQSGCDHDIDPEAPAPDVMLMPDKASLESEVAKCEPTNTGWPILSLGKANHGPARLHVPCSFSGDARYGMTSLENRNVVRARGPPYPNRYRVNGLVAMWTLLSCECQSFTSFYP